MKLLVTCIHLIRHLEKYSSLLENYGINFKAKSPIKQQFSSYEMLNLLPGFNFIIAGDYRASHNSSYVLSVNEASTEILYKSKHDNLNVDVTSNLDFFADDPEYGIYLKVYTVK